MHGTTTQPTIIEPWFHPKHKVLFAPTRYKVLYGSRAGLKSWAAARALLLLGARRKLRILCAREFQQSIKESVHELLSSQIEALNLSAWYEIQRDLIRGKAGTSADGTEFIFIGLHLNTSKVKSYEDVDICWIEEADSVTDASWMDLLPTIRKPSGGPFDAGAEIWVTFNPRLETDATYQRFIVHPPTDSVAVKTTYKDNPYLSAGIKQEIEDLKRKNFDQYLHVWEGFCKQTLEGAVYADELRDASTAIPCRICKVPYDHAIPVNTYWDLGRSDHTSIWFVQQAGYEYHLIDFYEDRLKHIDHYIKVMQDRSYIYDTIWLPHDAKAKQLGSRMTIEEQVRAKFPNSVRIVPRASIADKINAARTVFANCWFDSERTSVGVQHLRHYTYDVDEQTKQFSDKPLHDEHSDAGSAFEYFGLASRMPSRRPGGSVRTTLQRLGLRRGEDFTGDSAGIGWMR